MNVMQPKFGAKSAPGQPVKRKEDANFITGMGQYNDDVKIEGVTAGFVLRSPVACGPFTINDLGAAESAPGVHAILTAKDLEHLGSLTTEQMAPQPDGSTAEGRVIPLLCKDAVRYVGDAVAFIVADTLEQAKDASELIDITYEGGEAVTDTARALDDDAPLVWQELGTNRCYHFHQGDKALVDAAFAEAARTSRVDFLQNRLVSNYMEVRSAIGDWNAADDQYTLHVSSQGVHGIQRTLKKATFDKDMKLRVLTHDVGGGFGPKVFTYREYALVLEAAKRVGKPVKWLCDRTEHFLTDAHGRDNVVSAEMAMDADGRFTGLRIHITAAMGGYTHEYARRIPLMGAMMATGIYDIQALDQTIIEVYTHTCPTDAYRGAGRPEAAFLIEKLVDQCARDMGMSPAEIRRKNFIRPEQMPYKTVAGRLYDVGEFDGHMTEAMAQADWDGFEARRKQSQAEGKFRGIGMSTYIEACAFAGSEPAFVTLNDDGTVTLDIGTQSNGQGHHTAYAQFLGAQLGLDVDAITVRQGDTDLLARGGGTGGSRSIPLGGVSVSRAGEALAKKIRARAGEYLEADPRDIELAEGSAIVVGTDRKVSFAEIAAMAESEGGEPMKADGNFKQEEATYPNGTHICEVEIDPETGTTEVLNYTIVDDFGFTVNPDLLAGQVHGGAAQGIGQALLEGVVYDENGQLLTASFMDYAMPRADSIPNFSFDTRNVPSTHNAMGIKGAGEAGTIGACPAVVNAVTNALYLGCGIQHVDMPMTPPRVWRAIQDAEAKSR